MPLDTIINIPITVVKLGISSKYNQPINDDHNILNIQKVRLPQAKLRYKLRIKVEKQVLL